MKKNGHQLKLFILALIQILATIGPFFILSSCDGPRDRRIARLGTSNSTGNNSNTSQNSSNDNGDAQRSSGSSSSNSSSSSDNGSDLSNGQEIPAEFSRCDLGASRYNHYNALIGDFNICSSKDVGGEKLYFQTKNTISDYRVCIFPTNDESNGGSVMVGSAKCLFTKAGKGEVIELSANRDGFTQRVVNGIMIVKDKAYGEVTPYHQNMMTNPPTFTQAYEDCMVYLFNTGDAFACQRFKAKGQYVYTKL